MEETSDVLDNGSSQDDSLLNLSFDAQELAANQDQNLLEFDPPSNEIIQPAKPSSESSTTHDTKGTASTNVTASGDAATPDSTNVAGSASPEQSLNLLDLSNISSETMQNEEAATKDEDSLVDPQVIPSSSTTTTSTVTSAATEKIAKLEKKLREKDAHLAQVRAKTKAFVSELKKGKARIQDDLNEALTKLKKRNSDLAEVTSSAKTKITELRECRATLESEVASLKAANSELVTKCKNDIDAARESMEKEKGELTAKHAKELEKQSIAAENARETLVAQHAAEAEAMKSKDVSESEIAELRREKEEGDELLTATIKQKEELLVKLNKMEAQAEDNDIELNRMKLELKTLKDLLRDNTSEHEIAKQEIARLVAIREERDQATAAAAKSAETEQQMLERMNEAVNTLETAQATHVDEIEKARAQMGDAIAARNELEATIETLRAELKAEKADAVSKKRTAVAYIEALKEENQTLLDKQSTTQKEVEDVSAEVSAKIEAISSLKKKVEELEERVILKDKEMRQVEAKAQEAIQAVKDEAELVKTTRIQMDATVESKLEETAQHKRLRQLAKKETVALAKELERHKHWCHTVHSTFDSNVLPQTVKLGTALQDLEWKLDAALSAVAVLKGNTTAEQGGASHDESRAAYEGFSHNGESSDLFTATQKQLQSLKEQLDLYVPDATRITAKVEKLSEFALEETSIWSTAVKSIRRTVGDCIAASTNQTRAGSFHPLNRTASTSHAEESKLMNASDN